MPSRHNRELRIPECILCFYDVFIVEDHSLKRLYLVANGRLQEAGRRLRLLKERIFELNEPEERQFFGKSKVTVTSNFKKEEYLKAVEDVIHYITEGDIYIANLTQQLCINSSRPPYEVFKRLIDEIEHSRRNLYTGSMGYLTLDGSCDFNIVIRTALHQDGRYYLGVGGGITCESEPEFEYEETLQKAKAILEALT